MKRAREFFAFTLNCCGQLRRQAAFPSVSARTMRASTRVQNSLALICAGLLATAAHAQEFESSAGLVEVETVVSGLERPWGFAFLPDGGVLITERPGALRHFKNGALSAPIPGLPDVYDSGQGGLLDVALARDFAESGEIYMSYAASDGVFSAQTRVARATFTGDALTNVEVIFRQEPSQSGGRHFGSRIVVADDGSLFVTIGDRGEAGEAQNPASHQGSVIRILRDGAPHPDNPFLSGDRGWKPEIYSYGHRNPQGATFDSEGVLWTVEHGAKGGDEINRPANGANFGWPIISYGRHYSGGKIGVGRSSPGMEQPVHYWDPSIAPSGLVRYEGAMFPEWRGDLLVGALKYQLISRLDVEAGRVIGEERLFDGEFGRIRDIRVAPDGSVWFATDEEDGGLFRLFRR